MEEKKARGFSNPEVREKARKTRMQNKGKKTMETNISQEKTDSSVNDSPVTEFVADYSQEKDFFHVDGKKDKKYRHVRREPRRVEELKKKGWVVVDRNAGKALMEGNPVDTTTGIPEAILMEKPLDMYNAERKARIAHKNSQFLETQAQQIEGMKKLMSANGLGTIKEVLSDMIKRKESIRR